MISDEDEREDANPRFSIEANVGKEVAAKLILGGKVRIGKNGKLLAGQEGEDPDEHAIFHDK